MAYFKKLGLFAAPLALAAGSAGLMTGCDGKNPADALCGPCGVVAEGDIGISGNAKLDGFFAAVSQLNNATIVASADFEGGLANLEAAFGLEGTGNLSARVDALVAQIRSEISANASGGLIVDIAPAKCSASMEVAVSAQAQCEAKAGCTGEVDPGSVDVVCEGECTGSCEGTCSASATAQCTVDAGGISCEGTCEGACELTAAAACEGTCKGDCSGTCSAYNASGECAGSCNGTCMGTCELNAAASCSGTCTGKCTADAPAAGCEAGAELKCEGGCEGNCSAGCEGSATPPSARANCEASADCNAQASAQGSASLECKPPSIEIGFEFTGSADARASFSAKMAALKANAGVMVQSFVKYQALITGEVNGEVAFDPAPAVLVATEFQGLIQLGVEGEFFADIPAGRIPCLIPAMQESVTILADMTGEAATTLEAQASFFTAFSTGFSS